MYPSTLHTGARQLLELWERAVAASPADRGEALLAAQGGAPATSLGAHNAALLALRSRLFGSLQPLRCNCAACGATTEFTIDCDLLARDLLPAAESDDSHALDTQGFRLEFRVPTVADVQVAAARAQDSDGFVRALLEQCVTSCARDDGVSCDPLLLPADVAEALSRRLEILEPGAAVSFELSCPECQAHWTARMDCADVLWGELQARAERLLLDVDALARAYGWSEAEVLALSPTRRAAYLQLLGAAW